LSFPDGNVEFDLARLIAVSLPRYSRVAAEHRRQIDVSRTVLEARDGAAGRDEDELRMTAFEDAALVLVD